MRACLHVRARVRNVSHRGVSPDARLRAHTSALPNHLVIASLASLPLVSSCGHTDTCFIVTSPLLDKGAATSSQPHLLHNSQTMTPWQQPMPIQPSSAKPATPLLTTPIFSSFTISTSPSTVQTCHTTRNKNLNHSQNTHVRRSLFQLQRRSAAVPRHTQRGHRFVTLRSKHARHD